MRLFILYIQISNIDGDQNNYNNNDYYQIIIVEITGLNFIKLYCVAISKQRDQLLNG